MFEVYSQFGSTTALVVSSVKFFFSSFDCFSFRPRLGGEKGMKRIILEYSSIILFESFNGKNKKFIILFESLSGREWNE